MTLSYYYLAIPVAVGILFGVAVQATLPEQDAPLLSKQQLTEGGSPVMGQPDAEITILEWGDYQCTFCFRFHQSTLDTIKERYIETGVANLVFKDFPLNGPDSVLGAHASYCAGEQDRYWEYHDILYTNWAGERTGWITTESLERFAADAGIDIEEFAACMQDNRYVQKISELQAFGRDIGVDATPSFFIFNDESVVKIRGNQPEAAFDNAIKHLVSGDQT